MEKEGLMVLEEDQKVILFTRIIRDACGEYFDGGLDQDFLLPPCFCKMFFLYITPSQSKKARVQSFILSHRNRPLLFRGVAAVHGLRCSCTD